MKRLIALCMVLLATTGLALGDVVYPAENVIHVSLTGNDANDGSCWDRAKRHIQAGINAAASGYQVWVKEGLYSERITLKSGIPVYGGFAGTEVVLEYRDWKTHITTISGGSSGTVVTVPAGATIDTRIDGFTIRDGWNGNVGGGLNCENACVTIANNTFTANYGYIKGGAMHIRLSSNFVMTGNTITGNEAYCHGGAMMVDRSWGLIANNRITGNHSHRWGGGISMEVANPIIASNIIANNWTEYYSPSSPWGPGDSGGGIWSRFSWPTVINNTIVDNRSRYGSGVFVIYNDVPSATFKNNIVAFNNNSGIYCWTDQSGPYNLPVLGYNCLYGHNAGNYVGVRAGMRDMCFDPVLLDRTEGDYHLAAVSFCIDAGDNAAVQAGWTDMDYTARIQGRQVDVGADEVESVAVTRHTFFVNGATGDDANDGTSWQHAKRTIAAGLIACCYGDEVWVAGGTYAERIYLKPDVALYGGFGGFEVARTQRNWNLYPTVIDGQGYGPVVTAPPGCDQATRLDGFTVQGGAGLFATGIRCEDHASPTIVNNKITDSWAEEGAPGIYCNLYSSPVIANNVISGNACYGYGGAVLCENGSSPLICNNTVYGNYDWGGSLASMSGSSPQIRNNILYYNMCGIFSDGTGTPVLQCNCLYMNDMGNYVGVAPGSGDIEQDPLFADYYHLAAGSPCIDRGADSAVQGGWMDLDGRWRQVDIAGIGNAGVMVDIGADEYSSCAADTTAPEAPFIVSSGTTDLSTVTIHASWAVSDPDSSIVEYQYAIGTTSGGTDITNWTSTTATSVSVPVGRVVGRTYFISVKAKNCANLWSTTATAEGIRIDDVWVCDALIKVLPNAAKPTGTGSSISISAVRNEYESAQIGISAGSQAIAKIEAKAGTVSGPPGATVMPTFQVRYVDSVPVVYASNVHPWHTDTDLMVVTIPSPENPVTHYVPDPLLVVSPGGVNANTNRTVWVTAKVPMNAVPGTYTTTVSITTDRLTTNVPVTLTVSPVVLPDLHPTDFEDTRERFKSTVWIWPESKTPATWNWDLVRQHARTMAEHRLNVIMTPIMELTVVQRSVNGQYSFDFQYLDRWIEIFKEEGVLGVPGSPNGPLTGLIEGKHVAGYHSTKRLRAPACQVDNDPTTENEYEYVRMLKPYWPLINGVDNNYYMVDLANPTDYACTTDVDEGQKVTEWRTMMGYFLPALHQHLRDRGWDQSYYQHVQDEPGAGDAQRYRDLSDDVRAWSGIPVGGDYQEFKIMDAVMTTDLVGAVDLWIPMTGRTAWENDPVGEFDANMAFYQGRQAAGDQVWFYTCCWPTLDYMNRFIDQKLILTRLLQWANYRYGIPGYLHWGYKFWPNGNPYYYTQYGPTPMDCDWDGDGQVDRIHYYAEAGDGFVVYPAKRAGDPPVISSIRFEAMRDGIEEYELLKTLEELDFTEAQIICQMAVSSLRYGDTVPHGYVIEPGTFNSIRTQLIQAIEQRL